MAASPHRVDAAEHAFRVALLALELLQQRGIPAIQQMEPFIGMTDDDIFSALAEARAHTEASAVLALVAAIEAEIRLDMKARARLRKSALNKQLNALLHTSHGKVRFDQILETWRAHAGRKGTGALGELAQLFKHRHWLAHGQYWSDKSGVRVDPERVVSVYGKVRTLLVSIAADFPLPEEP